MMDHYNYWFLVKLSNQTFAAALGQKRDANV